MFAVAVTLKIHPERMTEFLPLLQENARLSLSVEPACHRFDICTDEARPDEVLLYELYSDGSAFAAHLDSLHFKAFDAKTAAMIADKDVKTYRKVRI